MRWRGFGTRAIVGIVAVAIVVPIIAYVVLTTPRPTPTDGFGPHILPQVVDNEIKLYHAGGPVISVGEGQYSISTATGIYSWTDFTLNPGESLSLGIYTPGTYYVSFRYHNENVFSDVPVTVIG